MRKARESWPSQTALNEGFDASARRPKKSKYFFWTDGNNLSNELVAFCKEYHVRVVNFSMVASVLGKEVSGGVLAGLRGQG